MYISFSQANARKNIQIGFCEHSFRTRATNSRGRRTWVYPPQRYLWPSKSKCCLLKPSRKLYLLNVLVSPSSPCQLATALSHFWRSDWDRTRYYTDLHLKAFHNPRTQMLALRCWPHQVWTVLQGSSTVFQSHMFWKEILRYWKLAMNPTRKCKIEIALLHSDRRSVADDKIFL